MLNLVSNPYVVVLFFLVPVMAYLIYLCAVYKAQVDRLLDSVEIRETEIRTLKRHMDNIRGEKKLYTFVSEVDCIEDVVYWTEVNQHLRLTLKDGSLYVISAPTEYKLIIQNQSKEGTDK